MCMCRGADVRVTIVYETKPTAKAGAVQWLDPEQTAGKKHPYLFTQCQVWQHKILFFFYTSCKCVFVFRPFMLAACCHVRTRPL